MSKVRGRFLNGAIVLVGSPPDWEEGAELIITLKQDKYFNKDDANRIETPEEIEEWIRQFESIPPMQ